MKNDEKFHRANTSPVTFKRMDGDDETSEVVLEGYAAKYNKRTTIGGWFDEMIAPGAFDDVLANEHDVRCVLNHNPSILLGRCVNGSGTLELFADEVGLGYRCTINTTISHANDVQLMVERGDITQSSFSFSIGEETWTYSESGSEENDLRTIEKVSRLFDVSPVTFPAYQDTEVSKRSWESARAEHQKRKGAENKKNTMRARTRLISNKLNSLT